MADADFDYSILKIPLGTAGSLNLAQESDYFSFVVALDASGVPNLNGLINVAVGRDVSDFIPLQVNNTLKGYAPFYKISWAAQAGLTAYVFRSRARVGNVARDAALQITSPPAKQLVTSALASTFVAAAVTVGTSAVQLAAVDGARQGIIVENNGTVPIYLGGDNAVTVGGATGGIPVAAGAAFTDSTCTGALWAISGTAGQDVRVMISH